MRKIYTIGFTQKNAEKFFGLLKENKINVILDVRLNNTSQLSGFSKYPDIKFFLKQILDVDYINDIKFAPEDWVLKEYKANKMIWEDYIKNFNVIMESRNIMEIISNEYTFVLEKNTCLLCSENNPENCHRSLIAKMFNKIYGLEIVDL